MEKLDPNDLVENGMSGCAISFDRMIGKEDVRDKVQQLIHISEREGIPRTQVWRWNDRFDKKQQKELKLEGLSYQFLLVGGGYAFPHDVREAEDDAIVIPIPRIGAARETMKYAKKWGL
jgi:hypothetical protein